MFVCPNCQAPLSLEEVTAQRCAGCEKSWEGSPPKASDQGVSQSAGTLAAGDFIPDVKPKAEDVIEEDSLAAGDSSQPTLHEDHADQEPDGTVSLTDASELEGFDHDELTSHTVKGTPPELTPPDATLKAAEEDDEEFNLEEILSETVKGDTDKPSEHESSVEPGPAAKTASAGADATIDFSTQAGDVDQESEIARALGTHWMSVSAEDTTPTITLQSKYKVDEPKVEIVTPERTLKSKENSDAKDPDYEIISYTAEGSMGQVFLARQNSVQRIVAIKQLKDELAKKSSYRKKFLAEASVTGELDHPNIVPVHDLGVSQDGQLFYSMKMVRGQSWQSEIKSNTRAENLDILLRVADAVAYAHSKNVIHRDLKPENIMLGSFGEVLVADWGVAVHLDRDRNFGLAGTPAYMAPEMASGPPEALGTHSDIYLLGAMLFEIVVGKAPHHLSDSTNQVLVHAAANDIVETDIQDELLTIARRAMATAPARRYPTVEAFKEAVRAYQTHTESLAILSRAENELAEAKQTGELESYARSVFGFQDAIELWSGNTRAYSGLHDAKQAYAEAALKAENFELGIAQLDANDERNQTLLKKLEKGKKERAQRARRLKVARRSAVALLGTLLLVAAGASIKFKRDADVISKTNKDLASKTVEAEQEAKRATKAEGEALAEAERATKAEKLANNEAIRATKAEGEALAEAERATKAEKLAKTEATRANDNYQKAQVAELKAKQGEQAALQGQFLSQIGLANSLIEENEFSRPRRILESLSEDPPDGSVNKFKKLIDWEWNRLHFLIHTEVDPLPVPQQWVGDDTAPEVTSIAATADGQTIAAARRGGQIQILRRTAEGIEELRTLSAQRMKIDSMSFSADGQRLAAGGQPEDERSDPALMVFDLASADAAPQFQMSSSEYWRVGGDTSLAKAAANVKSVDFHPQDSRVLLIAGYAPHALILKQTEQRQWQVIEKLPHWTRLEEARFSQEGNRVAVVPETDDQQRSRITVWSLVDNRIAGEPTESAVGEYHRVAFAPGVSGEVVFSDEQGVVRFWDVEQDEIDTYQLEGHDRAVNALAFSPDSGILATGSRDHLLKIWEQDAPGEPSAEVAEEGSLDWVPLKATPYLRGHEGPVVQCVFLDEETILSLDNKGITKIWDYRRYYDDIEIVAKEEDDNNSPCYHATFSADASTVATAAGDGSVKLWKGPSVTGGGGSLADQALRIGHPRVEGNELSFRARMIPAPDGQGNYLATYVTDKPTKGNIPDDASLAIWDVTTGRFLHEQSVEAGEFFVGSSDSPRLVIGRQVDPQRVDYYQVLERPELTVRSFREPSQESVRAAAFQRSTGNLLLGMTNQRGKIITPEGASETTEKYLPKNIIQAVFTPAGDRLLTIQDKPVTAASGTGQLGRLIMTDLQAGERVAQVELTEGASFLLDVAKGGNANRAIVVAHPSGKEPGAEESDLTLVEVGSEGLKRLASEQGAFLSAAISPDGQTVVTLSKRTEGRRESLSDEEQSTFLHIYENDLAQSDPHPLSHLIARTNPSSVVLLDQDRLLTYGMNHNGKYAAHVWDLANQTELARMISGSSVLATQIVDQGRRIISIAENGVLYVWDRAQAENPRLEQQLLAPNVFRVREASIAPSGKFAVMVDVLGEAAVFDLETGTVQAVDAANSTVVDADCSEAHLAVLLEDGRITVREGAAGRSVELDKPVRNPKRVRLSRDGQAVACYVEDEDLGSDIRFWRKDPADDIHWLPSWSAKENDADLELPRVSAMAFSGSVLGKPNRRLIVGDVIGSLSVMQVNWPGNQQEEAAGDEALPGAEDDGTTGQASLRELFRWRGHAQGVLSVEFSADGRHLMSTSRRGKAKIWPTGQPGDAAKPVARDFALASP